jgi:4-hydroxybenzoyl-CoA thioesterase/acyl-CoA thioester hydrolase
MGQVFRTSRRVEFCHTDAAGIAYFGSFFAFMEQAEHELLRSVGLSVVMHDHEGKLSWPRVAVQANYTTAANFEDVLDIDVHITRLGEKSVTYAFELTRAGTPIATGQITAVCCRFTPRPPPQSVPNPADISAKLQPFLCPHM